MKRRVKKALALVLTLCMALSLLPAVTLQASAEEVELPYGGFSVECSDTSGLSGVVFADGVLTISKAGTYTIGKAYENKSITARIVVDTKGSDDDVTLKLDGVNVVAQDGVTMDSAYSALEIKKGNVTLEILEDSSLTGGHGIEIGPRKTGGIGGIGIDGSVTVTGYMTLTVNGGKGGLDNRGGIGIDGDLMVKDRATVQVNGGDDGWAGSFGEAIAVTGEINAAENHSILTNTWMGFITTWKDRPVKTALKYVHVAPPSYGWLAVTGEDLSGIQFDSRILTISKAGIYKIANTYSSRYCNARIVVNAEGDVTLKLDGAGIVAMEGKNSALEIKNGNVTLEILNDSYLIGGFGGRDAGAGIIGDVTVTGEKTLSVNGGQGGLGSGKGGDGIIGNLTVQGTAAVNVSGGSPGWAYYNESGIAVRGEIKVSPSALDAAPNHIIEEGDNGDEFAELSRVSAETDKQYVRVAPPSYGDFTVTSDNLDGIWYNSSGILIFNEAGEYTLSNSKVTTDRIVVTAPGVTLNLNGVNIEAPIDDKQPVNALVVTENAGSVTLNVTADSSLAGGSAPRQLRAGDPIWPGCAGIKGNAIIGGSGTLTLTGANGIFTSEVNEAAGRGGDAMTGNLTLKDSVTVIAKGGDGGYTYNGNSGGDGGNGIAGTVTASESAMLAATGGLHGYPHGSGGVGVSGSISVNGSVSGTLQKLESDDDSHYKPISNESSVSDKRYICVKPQDVGNINVTTNVADGMALVNGVLSINKEGVYTLSNKTGIEYDDVCRIIVDVGEGKEVTLKLNNLNIRAQDYHSYAEDEYGNPHYEGQSALDVLSGSVTLETFDGTSNKLRGGPSGDIGGVGVKGSVTVTGTGRLSIIGGFCRLTKPQSGSRGGAGVSGDVFASGGVKLDITGGNSGGTEDVVGAGGCGISGDLSVSGSETQVWINGGYGGEGGRIHKYKMHGINGVPIDGDIDATDHVITYEYGRPYTKDSIRKYIQFINVLPPDYGDYIVKTENDLNAIDGVSIQGGRLTFSQAGTYNISMKEGDIFSSEPSSTPIVVDADGEVNLNLSDVRINLDYTTRDSTNYALWIKRGNVKLTNNGTSSFTGSTGYTEYLYYKKEVKQGGHGKDTVKIDDGGSLTVTGEGTLTIRGGKGGSFPNAYVLGGNGGNGINGSITVAEDSNVWLYVSGGKGGKYGGNFLAALLNGKDGKAVTGTIKNADGIEIGSGSTEYEAFLRGLETLSEMSLMSDAGYTTNDPCVIIARIDTDEPKLSELTKYDVWVGDTQVTSRNAHDVLSSGAVSYSPAANGKAQTLSLNGYTGSTISATDDLMIDLTGASTITGGEDNGITVTGKLYIGGDGSLTVSGTTTAISASGISAPVHLVSTSGASVTYTKPNTGDFIVASVGDYLSGISFDEDEDMLTISEAGSYNIGLTGDEPSTEHNINVTASSDVTLNLIADMSINSIRGTATVGGVGVLRAESADEGITADSGHEKTDTTVSGVAIYPKYDVWVGGVQVTGLNRSDIPENGTFEDSGAVYTPAAGNPDDPGYMPQKLTLTNVEIKSSGSTAQNAGIYFTDAPLTLELKGAWNSVTNTDGCGIYADGNLTIVPGDDFASLKIEASGDNENYGIYAAGDVDIACDVDTAATGVSKSASYGVFAAGTLTVRDGAALKAAAKHEAGVGTLINIGVGAKAENVVVEGESSDLSAEGCKSEEHSAGLWVDNGSISVLAGGKITALGDDAKTTSAGLCLEGTGSITVEGEGSAIYGSGLFDSYKNRYGIYAPNGTINVSELGSLTGNGGTDTDLSVGVYAKNIGLSDRYNGDPEDDDFTSVYGDSGSSTGDSIGVHATNIRIVGGSLSGYGSYDTISDDNINVTAGGISAGVMCDNFIEVSGGGHLYGDGGAADKKSYGVTAHNAIELRDSALLLGFGGEAKDESCGVCIGDNITFSSHLSVEDSAYVQGEGDSSSRSLGVSVGASNSSATIEVMDGALITGVGGAAEIESIGVSIKNYAYENNDDIGDHFASFADVIVDSGSLIARSGEAGSLSCGIYADNDILSRDGGYVSGTGSRVINSSSNEQGSYGMMALGRIMTASDGSLFGSAGAAEGSTGATEGSYSKSVGLSAGGEITTDGIISGTASAADMSCGIWSNIGTNFLNGTLTGRGGIAGNTWPSIQPVNYRWRTAPDGDYSEGMENAYVWQPSHTYAELSTEAVPIQLSAPVDDSTDSHQITIPVSGDGGSVNVSGSISSGTASLSLTKSQLGKISSGAQGSGAISINLSALNTVDSAVLPSELISAVSSGAEGLEVILPTGTVKLDETALQSVNTGKDVVIISEEVNLSALTKNQISMLGSRTENVVIINVSVLVNNVKVTDFNGGSISVSIPYTAKAGEDTSKLVVWSLADDGSIEAMNSKYNATAKCCEFTTMHLSTYMLSSYPFTDVIPANWFYADVVWAYNNGMFQGTGDTTFSPEMTTTRDMIVTVLYRLEGESAVTSANSFIDVPAGQWYTNAVIWAAENKIVEGYGNGKFGPTDKITREQMAAILYRYAAFKGYDVSASADFSKFTDENSISSYALTAMQWANASGLVNGKGSGILDPLGNAKRCEVSAILHRFCEKVAQ